MVSFLLNLLALTLPEFMMMSPLFDTDGLHFWLLILITTDVGLAIGSKTSNREEWSTLIGRDNSTQCALIG